MYDYYFLASWTESWCMNVHESDLECWWNLQYEHWGSFLEFLYILLVSYSFVLTYFKKYSTLTREWLFDFALWYQMFHQREMYLLHYTNRVVKIWTKTEFSVFRTRTSFEDTLYVQTNKGYHEYLSHVAFKK